jgi:hypothetical protein
MHSHYIRFPKFRHLKYQLLKSFTGQFVVCENDERYFAYLKILKQDDIELKRRGVRETGQDTFHDIVH